MNNIMEKIKLFQEIDRKLLNCNNIQNNLNNTQLLFDVKINNAQFDEIYCNFDNELAKFNKKKYINQNKDKDKVSEKTNKPSNRSYNNNKSTDSHFVNNSNNYKDEEKEHETEKIQKNYNKQSVRFNNNKSTNSHFINKSKNYTPPNNSGKRLYNYGYYLKINLEKKRRQEEENFQRQMTPQILKRPKYIFQKSTNFISRNSPIYKKRSQSQQSLSISNNTFKPNINKNSIKIANRLEPSITRLMKKKKKYKTKSISCTESFYSMNINSKTITENPLNKKKCNELYQKGMEFKEKRMRNFKEKKQKEQEEYKKYPFHPKITKNANAFENNNIEKVKCCGLNKEIYSKQYEWKKNIDNVNSKKRELIENKKKKECTFHPNISKEDIQNDEKFIMKNVDQINDYIYKRREVIKKNKEYEDYKMKRLGQKLNYVVKATIPKEFELKTKKRSLNRNKCPLNKINESDYILNAQKINSYSFVNN